MGGASPLGGLAPSGGEQNPEGAEPMSCISSQVPELEPSLGSGALGGAVTLGFPPTRDRAVSRLCKGPALKAPAVLRCDRHRGVARTHRASLPVQALPPSRSLQLASHIRETPWGQSLGPPWDQRLEKVGAPPAPLPLLPPLHAPSQLASSFHRVLKTTPPGREDN